ncbi:MAG TPA: hypothetical protein VND64_11025, partial [Pirellulales bacterium]|nr:hypothetical protein [Pirellulales bacterium]
MVESTVHRPLCDALRVRNALLAQRAERLILRAEEMLTRSVATFPTGTEHGPPHTRALEHIAVALLPETFLAELTGDEVFFLALACHYHDRGMVGSETDNASPEGRSAVREQHAVRVRELLRRGWESLGFEDQNEAEVLGDVCVGHRPVRDSNDRASWPTTPEQKIVRSGVSVRLRLLCALIYAIDELHIGSDRAPVTVEAQAGIENATSKRHWRRHQRTFGPVRHVDSIDFEVKVTTLALESDLRRNHLRKAFLAVADLRRESGSAGIAAYPRPIVVRWNRGALWELLIIEQLAAMDGRNRDALVEAVADAYTAGSSTFTRLQDFCREIGDKNQWKAEIGAAVDLMLQAGWLSKSNHNLTLAVTRDAHKAIYERVQEADDEECLLSDYAEAYHLFDVFRNAYGKRYVSEYLIPEIQNRYSVCLTADCAVPHLWEIVKAFPSAAEMASRFGPPVSPVEKRESLAAAAVAGALVDVLRNPFVLLDPATRNALREGVSFLSQSLEKHLRFLEELAVVRGFSWEQLRRSIRTPGVWDDDQ